MTTTLEPRPKRLIAFVDADCFFASVEQQGNPLLRGKPMGVIRKPNLPSVISAASREAKRIGVKSPILTTEAFRICRTMKIVLEDPEKYTWASSQLFKILSKYTPRFQAMSVDEGWADITQTTEQDFYGNPEAVARDMKQLVREKFGPFVTVSIGIADSRIMSKFACERNKPNGFEWLKPEDIPSLLDTLEVDAVCGINKGFKRRLNNMGIYTLGELGRCPRYRLRHYCKGVWGDHLKLTGQGLDNPMMFMDYVNLERKGYSHGRVLRLGDNGMYPSFKEAKRTLKILCMKLGRRLRSDGKAGRVVHFSGTSAVAGHFGKQKTLSFPTNDDVEIFEACVCIGENLLRQGKYLDELDGIAVHVTKLSNTKSMTLPLLPEYQRRHARYAVMDEVNDHYGDRTIYTLDNMEGLRKFNWFAQNRGMYRDIGKYFSDA